MKVNWSRNLEFSLFFSSMVSLSYIFSVHGNFNEFLLQIEKNTDSLQEYTVAFILIVTALYVWRCASDLVEENIDPRPTLVYMLMSLIYIGGYFATLLGISIPSLISISISQYIEFLTVRVDFYVNAFFATLSVTLLVWLFFLESWGRCRIVFPHIKVPVMWFVPAIALLAIASGTESVSGDSAKEAISSIAVRDFSSLSSIERILFPSSVKSVDDAIAAVDRGDYEEALKWYKRQSSLGNETAMNNLGVMYDKGQGVDKDLSTALRYFERAAKKGLDIAQNNMGKTYFYGLGVPIDYEIAREWFDKASKNGIIEADYYLAVIFHDGLGGKN